MDSRNSSGMQSSSGGDEDHDSRPDSIPAVGFLGKMLGHQPPPHLLRHQNHPPSFSDPPPNPNLLSYFVEPPENSASNIMLDRDILWPPVTLSGGITSDLNNSTCTARFASLSSSVGPAPVQSSTRGNEAQSASLAGKESSQSRPRKRTRASRKTPTTVLTTDTTNFRAMVQEFTGIPAAPFCAPASPYPRRIDLLAGASGGFSLRAATANPFSPPAQKSQISPPRSSNPNPVLTTTNMVENFVPGNNKIQNQSANFNSGSNLDLQFPSDDNGEENPFFAFLSDFSQQLPRYLSANQSGHENLVSTISSVDQDRVFLRGNIGGLSDVGPASDCAGARSNTSDDGSGKN